MYGGAVAGAYIMVRYKWRGCMNSTVGSNEKVDVRQGAWCRAQSFGRWSVATTVSGS